MTILNENFNESALYSAIPNVNKPETVQTRYNSFTNGTSLSVPSR